MRRISIICALTLILLSCDSVDRPEEIENGANIEAATQSLPLPRKHLGAGPFIEITVPPCPGPQPALVPPISTFEWQTIEGVEDPDSVRWIMVNTNQFNDDWNETLNFVRDNPDAPRWHPWTAYDPIGGIGTAWTTPPYDYGSFVFAVHGWDADSTAAQDFDWERNAVRVRVLNRSTGPIARLTSDFMAPVVSFHTNTPITVVDLPGGTPITFCWTADASTYCGVVEVYRYGWDIIDLDDDAQWESGFTPSDGSEACSATRTFLFGTHTFHVEVVDNSGFVTRIPIKINVTPAHVYLPLDIRPGSCANPLNPKSNGVLSVALLGSQGFDVRNVDLETLALYDADMVVQGVKPGRSSIKDVTTPPNGGADCDCPANDADGLDDLHIKFSMNGVARLVKGAAMGDVAQLALVGLFKDGTPFMAVDCARIVGFQFEDEEPPATGDLDTEIIGVMSTYYVNGQVFEENIDINDAVPDTVPHGSWIRVSYRATPDAMSYCPDQLDDCIGFQKNFTWSSALFPGVGETTSWQPVPPEDNDPFTSTDSTSLNVGPVEYTVRFRSADKSGGLDLTSAEVPVVGNFPPTLDDFGIEHHDGTLARDGESVVWDWWNPANFHGSIGDTLDLSDPPNLWVVREFFFLVKGLGSDHPKEGSMGGVRSWFYEFTRSDDPAFNQPFGRAGYWADGITVNSVCDTVKLKIRYSYTGDPGGKLAWEALPDWVNRWYDFNIRGKDTGSTDTFDQFMFVNGMKTKINTYSTAALGRETEKGTMRFYLTIVR